MNYLLLTLASNAWAIEPNFALSIISELEKLLPYTRFERMPEQFEASHISSKNADIVPYTIDEFGNTSWNSAKKGFVAAVSLRGVMTKHPQICGPSGCETIGSRIIQADRHQNSAGTMLIVESGGGAVNAINPIIDALSSCTKPTAIFIDDIAASAALMITPFADVVMARNEMSQIGSLGVMGMYQNDEKKMEAEGIKLYSYYSKYSFNKNKNEMEALQGNGELLLNNVINPIARNLLSLYAQKRGKKLRDNISTFFNKVDSGKLDDINPKNVFTGEMFFASECLPVSGNGLIDSIGSISDCAEEILKLSKTQIKISVK